MNQQQVAKKMVDQAVSELLMLTNKEDKEWRQGVEKVLATLSDAVRFLNGF